MRETAGVTPQYVHGLNAERELPIIRKIALGSLRNKLLIILPAVLLLSEFLPFLLTPILMIGGAYLCYEGAEKIWHRLRPHEESHATMEDALPDEKAIVSGVGALVVVVMTLTLHRRKGGVRERERGAPAAQARLSECGVGAT
ncbi:hypothetical protein IN07_15680 [Modestobacter caceresii]|uniref:ABC transporter n=1 Tax=Modestobacter caceresii TaxID=1522368 RepID=A0A098Y4Z2_9ACTN|nr:DUF808 family protein [Modestobacter caceresii]KGH45559.1 hypothetical protein IN07_15680 [Modestobacter caceresii]